MKSPSSSRLPQTLPAAGPSKLHLTLAMTEYDHISELVSGHVQPAGIALTPLLLPIEEVFHRYLENAEFDIAETPFAKYTSMVAAGDSPVVAIPVFPSRVFRHSSIYVRKDSGITDPKGLEGRAVGIPEWVQTAGVYVRGLLSEYYGVALDRVQWIQAGVNEPGRAETAKLDLPSAIRYETRPDKSLSEMLVSGEVDAVLSARAPASFLRGDPRVARLFPAFRAEEEAYHAATKIFPIMHVVTMRRSVFEAYPWVAMNMLTAFDAAKKLAIERMRDITASRIALPWGAALAEEATKIMGEDLWPYGVASNRTTLDAFCRFLHDQYITAKRLTPEDLFPQEVISLARV